MVSTVYTIPVASTAFLDDVKFSKLLGRKCSLKYSYEGEEDFSIILEEVIFDGVESFKCTYFMACSLEMHYAYDKVLNVGLSQWLNEIIHNLSENQADPKNLKHFRIYFDDGPCYEFICRSFQVVKEEKKDSFENPNQLV